MTLSELLKLDENQIVVLERIVDGLRGTGEWGRRGLFAKLGRKYGISPAYVGQVFNGNKPLRENFVLMMADHLKVSVDWLTGKDAFSLLTRTLKKTADKATTSDDSQVLFEILKLKERENYLELSKNVLPIEDGIKKFPELWKAFLEIPENERLEAFESLRIFCEELDIEGRFLLERRGTKT